MLPSPPPTANRLDRERLEHRSPPAHWAREPRDGPPPVSRTDAPVTQWQPAPVPTPARPHSRDQAEPDHDHTLDAAAHRFAGRSCTHRPPPAARGQGWARSRFEQCHHSTENVYLYDTGGTYYGKFDFELWILAFAYDGSRHEAPVTSDDDSSPLTVSMWVRTLDLVLSEDTGDLGTQVPLDLLVRASTLQQDFRGTELIPAVRSLIRVVRRRTGPLRRRRTKLLQRQ